MSVFRMFLWLTFLTGVLYPLLITLIPSKGGLVESNGKTVGSRHIAQAFKSDRYFWPRPSAVDYNPLPSGGSNLSPTSALLQKAVLERKKKFGENAPLDLLYASGSGLDPHISPEAAYFQVERVAKARGLSAQKLKSVIDTQTRYTFFGPPCVNVLLLNLTLDENGRQ